MAIGEHATRNGHRPPEGGARGDGVLGRLRDALARAFSPDRRGRPARTSDVRAAPPRARVHRQEPRPRRSLAVLDDEALFAVERERALRRVAAAASEACDDWASGLDVDEAMRRLRAELRSAAEFDA